MQFSVETLCIRMAANGNLNEKKTLRICLKWSSRSSRWLFWVFFLLDTVECFYRTVDILEIPSKWLVVLYHFRRQLFLPQVFNRISWFRLPSLVLTSYIHPFPDILSFLECWHEIIKIKWVQRVREKGWVLGLLVSSSQLMKVRGWHGKKPDILVCIFWVE